jgi:hypothetical protein
MLPRLPQKIVERSAQFCGLLAGKHVLDPAAMVCQYLRGNEQLPSRGIERQRSNDLDQALCESCVSRKMFHFLRERSDNHCRK